MGSKHCLAACFSVPVVAQDGGKCHHKQLPISHTAEKKQTMECLCFSSQAAKCVEINPLKLSKCLMN